jgi:hypothetical protein
MSVWYTGVRMRVKNDRIKNRFDTDVYNDMVQIMEGNIPFVEAGVGAKLRTV